MENRNFRIFEYMRETLPHTGSALGFPDFGFTQPQNLKKSVSETFAMANWLFLVSTNSIHTAYTPGASALALNAVYEKRIYKIKIL